MLITQHQVKSRRPRRRRSALRLLLWIRSDRLTSGFDCIRSGPTSVGNRGPVSLFFPAYSQPNQFPRICLSAKLFAEFPP